MTLDLVTSIVILFKLHQWSILLCWSQLLKTFAVWRYGWISCKISAMDFERPSGISFM